MASTFGALLRQLRRRSQLTQASLAAATGYSATFIANLEAGDRLPDLGVVATHFVPALLLADEAELAHRLLEAAAGSRRSRVSQPSAPAPAEGATSLPIPAAPLIGRAAEVKALADRLAPGGSRLLTVAGPPGAGKSRLALEVAHSLRPLFREGVLFVDLVPVAEPALLADALIESLGLQPAAAPAEERLFGHLRRQQRLLLLDNFEHVLAAAPLLRRLLAAVPGVVVLVTSRERLGLRQEQRHVVGPLAVDDAVQLFAARATAASPSFVLTESSRPVVAEICRLVDCLPLTVELSAAHSESYSPAELLQRLGDQRLALLARGGDDGPPRHRSLADALWRSYHLLGPVQQRLLRSLSLSAGGVDLASVRDLGWAPDDEWKALAAKFLVRATNEASGEWLSMLETVRAFALEQLQHAGEEASAHRAYGVHFLALARAAADGAGRTGAAARFARLERNNENLRSALRWCVAHDPALGRQLAAALTPFWYHRGYALEGARWLAELMAVSGAEGATAEMYYSYAHMLHQAGELAAADAQIQLALAAARAAGDDGWLAKVHHEAGWIAYNRVERRSAADHFQEAIISAVASGDEELVAGSRVSLAFVYGALGEHDDESLALLEQGVAQYQRLDLPAGSAFAIFNLGSYHVRHADYESARAAFYQAMAQFRALGDRRNLAWLLEATGETELLLGNSASAQALAQESLAMFRESGERWGEGLVLTHLGHIALLQGAMATAAVQFAAALELFVHLPNEYMVAMTAADLGGVAILSGRAALGWPLFWQAEVAVLQVEDLRRAFVTERLTRYRAEAARQLSSLPEPGPSLSVDPPAGDLAAHAMRVAAQLLAEL